jgi:hypothetical protein
MSKKFQIFVSSTYQDLIDEREQVIKSVLEMGHIPVGMEMFSAADEEQWKIIARQIDEIDYYVLILAHRYGSVTPEGISYTEKEYDYAVSKGVPILAFVIDDGAPWPKDRFEEETKGIKRLVEFKKKAKSRLIQFWKNREELHARVSISLMKAITANPRTGWVRASTISGPEVTNELSRLSSENAALRAELSSIKANMAEKNDEVRSTIKILSSNKRNLKVRKTGKWAEAEIFPVSLAQIFAYCAPSLIVESDNLSIAQAIALHKVGTGYFKDFPVGSNIVAELISDLVALDLVEPSKKKHPVSDKTHYWSLTKFGKDVHKAFRRVLLEESLPSVSDESDENGNKAPQPDA